MAAVTNPQTSLFERIMDNLDLQKSDVNDLIMDYFITEGYPSAAANFAAEANLCLDQDQTYIEKRVQIRDLILNGDVDQAIRELNELDVSLLDQDKKLHFSLLRLQLIEMIKKSFVDSDPTLVGQALQFATHNLAPYTPGSDQFRIDLERAMALLIVPKETWSNPNAAGGFGTLAELVQPEMRKKIAKEVNEAILKSCNHRHEANINYLVKARTWAEQQARDSKSDVQIPDQLDLGLDVDTDESHAGDTEMSENGGHAGTG